MKIISGYLKGRNLLGYDIDGTRPTMDRVKESLFAIIQNNIPDSIVLDLFSGSGNLGIEAISMGSKKAILVDKNKKAIDVIKRNVNNFDISDKVEIINSDYKNALSLIKEKIDIIFLDPPYNTDYIKESIILIDEYNILNKGGIIICESNSVDKIVYSDSFIEEKSKKYGDKWVVILKKM